MSERSARLRKPPFDSLATRIILFAFASTFATALVVSTISIHGTHRYLKESLDQQLPAALDRASERLAEHVAASRAELDALGDQPKRPLMERALGSSERITGLALRGADGSVRYALGTAEGLELPPVPDRGARIAPTGERTSTILTAVALPEDATLVAVLGADAIDALVARELAFGEIPVRLVDADGRTLGGEPAVPLDRLLSRSQQGVREYSDRRGGRMIGSAAASGVSGAWVAVAASYQRAFAPLLSVVTRIFVIDLGVILLFSFLAYKITSAVVKPIEALSDGARRIAQGDFGLEISEPPAQDEIGLLTRTFNDMMRRLRQYQKDVEAKNRALEDQNEALQQAKEQFEQLSITDGLTKLHNHRFFQDHLTREIKRVGRTGEPLSMILVDLDDFKALNDRLGHAAGDELLMRVARVMESSIRDSDLLARYGGEEFAVIASGTDLQGAYHLAEKIRTAIAEESFILDDSLRPHRATVSLGVALYAGNRKRFFVETDRALYRAKAQGKNCVVVADAEAGA